MDRNKGEELLNDILITMSMISLNLFIFEVHYSFFEYEFRAYEKIAHWIRITETIGEKRLVNTHEDGRRMETQFIVTKGEPRMQIFNHNRNAEYRVIEIFFRVSSSPWQC